MASRKRLADLGRSRKTRGPFLFSQAHGRTLNATPFLDMFFVPALAASFCTARGILQAAAGVRPEITIMLERLP
jgi:hypothetical protein